MSPAGGSFCYTMCMKKRAALIVIACVLVSGALYASVFRTTQTARKASTTPSNTVGTSAPSEAAGSTTELLIGKATAPITIIEYGDYKCPKCNELHQKAGKDIRREWVDTGKAKIIYRPYPLFGEDSGLALYASYCAAEQGKFTAYHDKMFSYMWGNYLSKGDTDATVRKLFSPEKLGELASEAGLDASALTNCTGGRTHAAAYNTAVDKAAGDSVQGTPTLIIGGQKVVGPQPYNVYKALLEVQ